jgi:hypothetical protein
LNLVINGFHIDHRRPGRQVEEVGEDEILGGRGAGAFEPLEERDATALGGVDDGEHALDEAGAGRTLRAVGAAAPEDCGAQGALGLVVGGHHAIGAHEGPERRPQAVQILGQGPGLAVVAVPGVGDGRADVHAHRYEAAGHLLARDLAALEGVPDMEETVAVAQ